MALSVVEYAALATLLKVERWVRFLVIAISLNKKPTHQLMSGHDTIKKIAGLLR